MKVCATAELHLLDRDFTIVVLIFGTLGLGGSETAPSRVRPFGGCVVVGLHNMRAWII